MNTSAPEGEELTASEPRNRGTGAGRGAAGGRRAGTLPSARFGSLERRPTVAAARSLLGAAAGPATDNRPAPVKPVWRTSSRGLGAAVVGWTSAAEDAP